MPRYDFRCTACSHIFEEVLPFRGIKCPRCPKCTGKVEKVISPPLGIHFKGTGFFATDGKGKEVPPSTSPEAKPSTNDGAKERTEGTVDKGTEGGKKEGNVV